ncbi:MAG: cyclopropane-fatty-acyl-phospholipid synthase family protein [Actinobacteria bacterium]|nr:cyclopropane-fatty-acyl-phospholipid synthase family protein [Actinomycetota bacterium]
MRSRDVAAAAFGSRARRIVERIHRRVAAATGHQWPIRLWDGTELGPDDAPFRLVLRRPSALRALLAPGDVAAGEAYLGGDVDVEGDLVAALRAAARTQRQQLPLPTSAALAVDLLRLPPPPACGDRRIRLRGRAHSLARDREAVRAHYDVGNDFYALFLDRNLVYSCAYFADRDEPLDVAQERKLDLICRKLALRSGDRFLDIGCGWGALVLHAARHYGVHATGVTISQGQYDLGRERIRQAGLADRVELVLADYREIRGRFDAVASVGMFEHVGPDELEEYFSRCFALTARSGRFLNHGITTGGRGVVRDFTRDSDTFLARYVFPDGGLVPAWEAVRHTERAGFELIDVEQLRPHYELTLRKWVRRLEVNHDIAVRAASEAVYRIWRVYMAAAAVGFATNELGVIQVLGGKGASLPLGRRWMLPTTPEHASPAQLAGDVGA